MPRGDGTGPPQGGGEASRDRSEVADEWAAPKLRGLTFYPDGAGGGQPIVPIDYATALANRNVIIE